MMGYGEESGMAYDAPPLRIIYVVITAVPVVFLEAR